MINGKKVLGIIPGRGGSKGIPQKNVKLFAGKPLIEWTIDEAMRAKHIDKLIVTSESDEIAKISISAGATVPFSRPKKLASDTATGNEVILHALRWFENKNELYDYFIYLQPTSIFRKANHIDKSIESFDSNPSADSLVSVGLPTKHPYWMKQVDRNGFLKDFIDVDKPYNNRQELPTVYLINGAIYISECRKFLEHESFYKGNCLAFEMNRVSSIDIDSVDDWNYAEHLFNNA